MSIHGDGRPPPSDVPLPRERVFERVLDAYRRNFDITPNYMLLGKRIPAMAHFYTRGERYVLTKKAKIWGVECSEYILFFTRNSLNPDDFRQISDFMEAAEAVLVKPHSEHMYTYLSAVVLTDELPDETLPYIRRYKWRRSYRFSLQGWCHIRVAVLDLSNRYVLTNRDGKAMNKALSMAMNFS